MLLLESGANPNIQGKIKGDTPLHLAAYYHDNNKKNKKDIIPPLLEFGANPYIKNKKGKTSFDIAQEKNFTEFPGLVIKHSQNGLLNMCLFYILNHLNLYEDQLDILPIELQDRINNLKDNCNLNT